MGDHPYLGRLRQGWRAVRLDQVVATDRPIVYGIVQAGPHVQDGVPYIKSTDVGGLIDVLSLAKTSMEIHEKYIRAEVQPDDLVFSLRGDIGQSSIVPPTLPIANLTQGTARISVSADFDVSFIRYVLDAPSLRKRIASIAKGSSFRELSLEQLREIEIPAPPLLLQRRIAKILHNWDVAIEKTQRLIAAKGASFNHLSRMLFSGRERFNKKRTNWQSVSLVDVTTEATARNGSQLGIGAVMGVNKVHGMIPMKDHVRAADLSRYKIVRPGAFAYNPMRLNIGSIAQNVYDREVLVSPDYVAFEAEPHLLLATYFDHLRRSWLWSRFVKRAGSGGVRIRIYYDDFADFVVDLPPLDEQRRIVDVLDTGRSEIVLLGRQCDALARQKRGLMQKLLTGEWPVAVRKPKEAAE